MSVGKIAFWNSVGQEAAWNYQSRDKSSSKMNSKARGAIECLDPEINLELTVEQEDKYNRCLRTSHNIRERNLFAYLP